MRKRHIIPATIITVVIIFLTRPKTNRPPLSTGAATLYPGTNLEVMPGDLLFTPVGKSESKYVGHVGIVNHNKEVVHSIPSGLVADSVGKYFEKFRLISVYSPIEDTYGVDAAHYLDSIVMNYPSAKYRILSPLGSKTHEQYCTKIVWQSYYYGAGINLGNFSGRAKGIHPELLKDKRYLRRRGKNL